MHGGRIHLSRILPTVDEKIISYRVKESPINVKASLTTSDVMWLIDVNSMKLECFEGTIPPYAILSHTWKEAELTFRDFQKYWGEVQKMKGSQKIECACKQARQDHLQYVWADVCCIDKSSSSELSEAINSMLLTAEVINSMLLTVRSHPRDNALNVLEKPSTQTPFPQRVPNSGLVKSS